jgi:hypothetical protein
MTHEQLSRNDWIRAATLAHMIPGRPRPHHFARPTPVESIAAVRAD